MEERALLSTFAVSNTLDSGNGSLRAAIIQANENPGEDTITFEIGTGVQTIQPLTALPEITDPIIIDGSTQPGFVDTPLIVLNGDLLPEDTFFDGLVVNTSNSLIKALVVNGFDEGTAIVIGGFGSSGVTGNRIEGSILGLNQAGTAAVPNAEGVRIANGATLNVVGGVGPAGNVISGNLGYGVLLGGTGTTGNRVIGNAIGTSADRNTAIGNTNGLAIGNGGTGNDIGGVAAGEGNLISGNTNHAIFIDGETTAENRVLGNRIGTNAAGSAALGDFTDTSGISIQSGAHDNIIGGTVPGARNQIAGVSGHGILITDPGTHGNLVQGNYIGISANGAAAIPNNGDGVFIVNSPNNVVGGDSAAAGNLISASERNGVTIFGAFATGNSVWGNLIGTDATGTVAIPNTTDGVRIDGASGNFIGGSTPVRSNLISGNSGNGITIVSDGGDQNIIQGNLIGVASGTLTALPNGGDGVFIGDGAAQNQIGGIDASSWNVIAHNGLAGVSITGTGTLRNTVRGNRIFSNEFRAIDLGGDGVTANDAQDSDNGPNGLQNVPVLTSADSGGGFLFVIGTLNSVPSSTYTLELYVSTANDGQGNGQGATPVTRVTVDTNSSGNAAFTLVLPLVLTPGEFLTATATDSLGNTSEISASALIGTSVPPNPILMMSSEVLNYQLQQPAVVVDATAVVTDADSENFNTGNITVSLNSKGERGEKMKLRNQGDGAGQVGLKGTKVKFGGTIIGKVKGGSGKKPLTVTFNASATPAAVSAVLKNITYIHTGKQTSLSTRTLRFQVTDDANHLSNQVNKTITIAPPLM